MSKRTQSPARLANTQSGNLPTPLNVFVGREREITDIAQLLGPSQPEGEAGPRPKSGARLLTLTGPGGCGKTRLALEVAALLLSRNVFKEGLGWVELAPLAEPLLIPQAIAAALKIRETPRRPLIDTLLDSLRPRQMLLVLDNCEHLLPAGAELVQALLAACPQLQILATSREALDIAGEKVWLVPSLSLPAAQSPLALERLADYEAIQLFVDRATEALPSFTLTAGNAPEVVRICQRVDGMPLALELAAARIKLLSPQQIAARLDDSLGLLTHGQAALRPRQQTLRATLDWSYDLLSKGEQALFRRLAVFAGGFTVEAVEAICGEPAATNASAGPAAERNPGFRRSEVLDTFSELVDKSLVSAAATGLPEPRYFRLLEPIRQYAQDQLQKSGEALQSRNQHLGYYQRLAETTFPYFTTGERSVWLKRLRFEADNLRAALRWAMETNQIEAGLQLAGDLAWFWFFSGLWSEGRDWQERFLEAAPGTADPLSLPARPLAMRAQALFGLGLLLWGQAQSEQACTRLEASALAWRRLGPSGQAGLARALIFLTTAMMPIMDLTLARTLQEEGAAICREIGAQWALGVSISNLGGFAREQGDFGLAATYYEESIAILRVVGDQWMLSLPLMGLGRVAFRQADYSRAADLFRESLTHCLTLEEKWFVSRCLGGLAAVAALQANPLAAARLFGADEALRQSLSPSMKPYFAQEVARALEALGPELREPRWLAAWAEGRALSLEQAMAFALGEPLAFNSVAEVLPRPAGRSVTPADSVVPLRIFAFGRGRVVRGEKELAPSDWQYAKPRELFFYLLCNKPQTKAQIGLALWPEASPAQLRRNLGVAVHSLRHALGQPVWIVFEKEQYSFNRALPYWFDVETFEAKLALTDRPPADGSTQTSKLLEDALKLWQGDLLEDFVEGDWYLLRREELQRQYLQALFRLGELHFAAGRYAEAAAAYRQAIERDNLLEDGHRALMRAYTRQGERGQALRHYQTVVDLMHTELNSAPAPETTALYERLRRGDDL